MMTLCRDFVKRVLKQVFVSYSCHMRWDSLFDDLEAQLDEQNRAQLRDEISENVRIERSTAELTQTLARFQGLELTIRLSGATEIRATLGPVSTDYLCLETDRSQWVIRRQTVESIALPQTQGSGLSWRHQSKSIRFASVIRGLLRDRSRCQIHGRNGNALAEGTLAQVAKDYLIIDVHPRDEFARPGRISGNLLIPLESIGWVVATTLN